MYLTKSHYFSLLLFQYNTVQSGLSTGGRINFQNSFSGGGDGYLVEILTASALPKHDAACGVLDCPAQQGQTSDLSPKFGASGENCKPP